MQVKRSTDRLSDIELIDRIVSENDTYLFSIIYDRYSKFVYNKCLGFSKSKEEAQDLTHDIFIKLFVKIRTFKGKSKFSTWLYAFTYNFCVNYVQRDKHKKNENRMIVDNDINDDENDVEDIDDEFIFQLKVDKLENALNLIDPRDKMILLLKYQEEMSIKEIEEILNIGTSAVKMRLKRAKIKVINVHESLS